jgi:hypothetical protein
MIGWKNQIWNLKIVIYLPISSIHGELWSLKEFIYQWGNLVFGQTFSFTKCLSNHLLPTW